MKLAILILAIVVLMILSFFVGVFISFTFKSIMVLVRVLESFSKNYVKLRVNELNEFRHDVLEYWKFKEYQKEKGTGNPDTIADFDDKDVPELKSEKVSDKTSDDVKLGLELPEDIDISKLDSKIVEECLNGGKVNKGESGESSKDSGGTSKESPSRLWSLFKKILPNSKQNKE